MKKIILAFVALLLFVLVVEILLFSPRDVNRAKPIEVAEIVQDVEDEIPVQQLSDIHLMESNEKGKEWELTSKEAALFSTQGVWKLTEVSSTLFGESEARYDVSGDRGRVFVEKKDMVIDGNVKILSSNKYEFHTDKAFYSSGIRQLEAPGPILMEGPGNQSGKSLRLTGLGMIAKLETNQIYILNEVKANRTLKDGQVISIQSDSAEFSGKENLARFVRNVVVDLGGSRITGPQAEFFYDKETNDVKSMSVIGGIKISDIDKFAEAERIDMFFAEKRYILKGKPRVVQNNDELQGEEIVFLRNGQEIEVKGAKANFENRGSE